MNREIPSSEVQPENETGKALELTTLERSLMRAMNLTDVQKLDEMFYEPISRGAEDHSESPDEEFSLTDRMYEEADRQYIAESEFKRLFKAGTSTEIVDLDGLF